MNNSVTEDNINNIKNNKDVQENDKIENSTSWKQSKLNDSGNKFNSSSQVFHQEDRKIPAFKPKVKVLSQQSTSAKSCETFQKVIPSFKAKTVKTSVMPSSQTPLNHNAPQTSSVIVTKNSNRSEKDVFRSKSVPMFNSKKMSDIPSKGNMKQNRDTSKSENLHLNKPSIKIASTNLNIKQISRKGHIPSASPHNMCKAPTTVKSTPLGYTVSTNNTLERIPLAQRNNMLQRPVATVPITPNMCKPNLTHFSGTPTAPAMKTFCPRTPVTPGMKGVCPSTPALKSPYPGTPSTPAMKRPYPVSF